MEHKNKFIDYQGFFKKGTDLLKTINYKGTLYRTALFWEPYLDFKKDDNIKYLEIGAFHGGNAISFALLHKNSEIHCVDPWLDYNDYPEYKNEQDNNYKTFLQNVVLSNQMDKFYIHRDFSFNKLNTFSKDYFDIIYIDGNHEPDYILEDAVLSFRLLKKNGYMIFDDYGWGDVHIGVDNFLKTYKKRIQFIDCVNCQVIIKKISD